MSFIAKNEKCCACNKTVYAMELIKADGMSYHKTCMKCAQCHCTLKLGNYAALGGKFYCKPHFKQLFALKGNYHAGFADGAAEGYVSGPAEKGGTPSPVVTHTAPTPTPAPTPPPRMTAPAPTPTPAPTPAPTPPPAPSWTSVSAPSAGPSESERKQLEEQKRKAEDDRKKLEAEKKAFHNEVERMEKELEAKKKETAAAEARAAAAASAPAAKEAPAPVQEGLSTAESVLCDAFASLLRDPQKKALALARAKLG